MGSNVKKWYLAGPMTGIPQFNFPKFDRIAASLRRQGYEIVSPAEMDDPEIRRAAMDSPDGAPGSGSPNSETWGDFLSRDVKLIADVVEGVLVMEGWEGSRGANLEVYVASACGKPIHFVYNSGIIGAYVIVEPMYTWYHPHNLEESDL